MVEIIRARKGNITLVGIGIEPEEPFVLVGGTQQLTARAKPKTANKGDITWSGGGTAIPLSTDGVITGVTAEARLSVRATSDAGFTDWVYARCGYDVTDLAFAADTLTIEGIQGVLFSLTPTPSNATEISYTTKSEDSSVADYYMSSTAAQKRMWGYNVGETTVNAIGRSKKAETPCIVTVNPVNIELVEIRAGYVTETTEQGDTLPPVIEKISIFAGQLFKLPVYFTPYNTTQRLLNGTFDIDGIADLIITRNTVFDRNHGIARYEKEELRGISKGVTNLTLASAQGEPAIVEIDVFNQGEISGSGSFSKIGGGEGWFYFSVSNNVKGFLADVVFVPDNKPASNNWSYSYQSPYSVRLSRQDGSRSGYPSGHLSIYLEDGTEVKLTNTVSGTI